MTVAKRIGMGRHLFCLRFGGNTGQKGYDVGARLVVRRVMILEIPVEEFGALLAGTMLDQLGRGYLRMARRAPALDQFGAPLNCGFVLGTGCGSRQEEGCDDQKQR